MCTPSCPGATCSTTCCRCPWWMRRSRWRWRGRAARRRRRCSRRRCARWRTRACGCRRHPSWSCQRTAWRSPPGTRRGRHSKRRRRPTATPPRRGRSCATTCPRCRLGARTATAWPPPPRTPSWAPSTACSCRSGWWPCLRGRREAHRWASRARAPTRPRCCASTSSLTGWRRRRSSWSRRRVPGGRCRSPRGNISAATFSRTT
mmetsp:Transcript_44183/g.110966  ORF Transcript_44183/g.110966 Transcript_44183/m.110966 type:complete len:204 (+) Transcript_44183:1388-1999(+)